MWQYGCKSESSFSFKPRVKLAFPDLSLYHKTDAFLVFSPHFAILCNANDTVSEACAVQQSPCAYNQAMATSTLPGLGRRFDFEVHEWLQA